MKKLLPITLGVVFAAVAGTSSFAQCSSGHVTADLGEQLYLSENQTPETAMSTYDPTNVDPEALILKLKETAEASE